ncbi:MAG: cysteine desulfurase family protein [Candidatus Altiarchaeota archaeon]
MKRIYLDNAATTKVADEAVEAMLPYFSKGFGNPSSLHFFGQEAKEALERSRETIAKRLNAKASEVLFMSGGTEANNLAIKGAAFGNCGKGKHIITTSIEHGSILNPCRWLEKQGFEVTYLDVDEHGLVDPGRVGEAIRKDTTLITIGHANNEIGTIQDISEIGRIARQRGVIFHTDACQSFTKTELDVKGMNVDMVTVNAHKINGPKGIGALAVRTGVKIEPQNVGGEQEHRIRSGTENIPGVVGFAKAVEISGDKEVRHMLGLRDKLIKGVKDNIDEARLNGHPSKRLCNNANFTFKGIEGESLLLRLDARGIACSTGSACSSQSLEPSHVLMALGLKPEEAHGSLRMTLGRYNTEEDVTSTVEALGEDVLSLRKISPSWR